MSEIKPIETYICCQCDTKHDDIDDAYDCCKPDVITVYACPTCGEAYDDNQVAIECCEDERSQDPFAELRVPAMQLEKYGQQRLAI